MDLLLTPLGLYQSLVGGDTQNSKFYDSSRDPQRRHHALEGPYLVYFKVAPRQTISAAILPKARTANNARPKEYAPLGVRRLR